MKIKIAITLAITTLFLSCSTNNVSNEIQLKKYFDEEKVQGCFALYNNAKGDFGIYNIERYRDSFYLPASTFKIVNSLIALETGKILNTKEIIKWDGIKRNVEAWNNDMNMEQAFKVSCVPYYQEVARRIGKDTMQMWLDSLQYGTKKINSRIDSFWLDNSLKVKADEELGLVKRLYFEQLPFTKTTMKAVKQLMFQEGNNNYSLSYKTGWGTTENGKALAWVVGWFEEEKHPCFFVLNFEGENNLDIVSIRKKLLMNCLHNLGYLKNVK